MRSFPRFIPVHNEVTMKLNDSVTEFRCLETLVDRNASEFNRITKNMKDLNRNSLSLVLPKVLKVYTVS